VTKVVTVHFIIPLERVHDRTVFFYHLPAKIENIKQLHLNFLVVLCVFARHQPLSTITSVQKLPSIQEIIFIL